MKKFEITEEQIKQAYDAACEDWKQQIKEWFPEWNKKESGWYKDPDDQLWLGYRYFENNIQYGFSAGGQWYNSHGNIPSDNEYPAPEKEVFERLKEEAIRRGFKEGVKWIRPRGGEESEADGKYDYEFRLYAEMKAFEYDGREIFRNGKWSEIISTPEPDEYITVNNIKYKRCN